VLYMSNRRWRQATAELAHDNPARISGWPSPRRERTSFNQEHQQPTACPEGGEILCSSISPIQCAVVCAVVQQYIHSLPANIRTSQYPFKEGSWCISQGEPPVALRAKASDCSAASCEWILGTWIQGWALLPNAVSVTKATEDWSPTQQQGLTRATSHQRGSRDAETAGDFLPLLSAVGRSRTRLSCVPPY
jgi:hypothetical protein